jgi:hypothetical protein
MANGNDPVSVECLRMVRQTDKAFGVNFKTDANAKNVQLWLPKSQVEVDGEADDEDLTLVMPRWLAEKNDLPYSE